MRNWNISNLLLGMIVVSTTIRLALAGLLLWAFYETDTPILRLTLWSTAVGMVVFSIWRVYRMNQFLKMDEHLDSKE